jgi:hypothetical protein
VLKLFSRLLTRPVARPERRPSRQSALPPDRRFRLNLEGFEDRSLPSTVVFSDTYPWGGSPETATVAVTVTEDAAGYEGLYLWNYRVTNNTSPVEFSQFAIGLLDDPATIGNLGSNVGWQGGAGTFPEGILVKWEGTATLGISESADFWFTTLPTAVAETTGFVADGEFMGGAEGPAVAPAPALVVNTHLDVVSETDAWFSLREAIIYTNGLQNLVGHQRITFTANLGGATITLNPNADDGYGQLVLEKKVFIDGLANKITIQRDPNAEQKHRLFLVNGGVEARLAHLKMQNGLVENTNGGAIISFGKLTIDDCVIRNNTTNRTGGGIQAQAGKLIVTGESHIQENTAEIGGGIFVNREVSAFITDSFIQDNTATTSGGGIGVNSSETTTPTLVVLTNTDVIENTAQSRGGGIYVSKVTQGVGTDLLLLSNTWLGDNQVLGAAGEGGGLYFGAGNLTLGGVTVSGNSATKGKGIYRVGGVTYVVPPPDVNWGGGNSEIEVGP